MGLDEFGDLSESNSSSSSNNTSSKKDKQSNKRKSYGPFGYKSEKAYLETVKDDYEIHDDDLIKIHMPIFPMITLDKEFEVGNRYRIKPMMKKFMCFSSEQVKVSDIAREIIMIDTGEVQLEKCLDVLCDRFDVEDIYPHDIVCLNMMAHTRSVVKLALGNAHEDSISAHSKDHILKAVYDEAYTARFRQTGEERMKHHSEIKPWTNE